MVNSTIIPRMYYSNTVTVNVSSGSIFLSGTGNLITDDEVRLRIQHPDGSEASYTHVYGWPANVGVFPTPPVDVTN